MSAEVKPGFKRTEAGVIPEDWDVTTIGQVVNDFRGGAPLKPSEFTSSGVRVLPKGGVGYGGSLEVAENEWQFCSQHYADKHASNQVDSSYTIVVLRDLVPSGPSIGLAVRITDPNRYVLAQGVYGIKVAPHKLEQGYIIQLSNTSPYRKLMNSIMVGSTQVHITNTAYKLAPIPLPPLPEQRVIAVALSDMDALISSLDQLIAKKRDIQQAAMQQLLTGQHRLPGFSGDWEVKRLGDFGQCLRGVTYKGDADLLAYDTDETYRLLRSNNVQQSAINTDGLQFVNAQCVSNHQILKPKDILICMANGSKDLVGKAGLFEVSDGHRYTFGAFMGCFRMKTGAEPGFIFALFGTHKYKNYIANLLAGSSINNLRPRDIEQMEFSFPSKNEQAAIATILSDMDTELTVLEDRRDKARQLKQGMMQELLTGKIRLINQGA